MVHCFCPSEFGGHRRVRSAQELDVSQPVMEMELASAALITDWKQDVSSRHSIVRSVSDNPNMVLDLQLATLLQVIVEVLDCEVMMVVSSQLLSPSHRRSKVPVDLVALIVAPIQDFPFVHSMSHTEDGQVMTAF